MSGDAHVRESPRLRLEYNSRRQRRGMAAFLSQFFGDKRGRCEPIGEEESRYRLTSTAAIQRAANSEARRSCRIYLVCIRAEQMLFSSRADGVPAQPLPRRLNSHIP